MALEKIERIASGVKGFDKLIDGGFPRGHNILISGSPGTGKTIFGTQFLYRGIVDNNEPGLYVSVEDQPDKLNLYAATFGWDLPGLIKKKKMAFLKVPIDQYGYKLVQEIGKAAKKIKAKRIVIDSLSSLSMSARMFSLPLVNQPDPTGLISRSKKLAIAGFAPFDDVKQFTHLLINRMSELGATTMFLSDLARQGEEYLTRDSVSEYVCDGVVQLQLHDASKNVTRTISVKKMRGGKIQAGMKALKFTPKGLEIGEFKAFY